MASKTEENHKYYTENTEQIETNRLRRREKLRAFLIEAKNKPCMDCGQSYPHYVMDFDHVRGQKHRKLSSAIAAVWSVERAQEEIDKCELVCANCHRIRTHSRKTY